MSEMIGLKRGTVKLSESQFNEWQREFEKEKTILLDRIGGLISEIRHIGSTSIPGIKAKPIIDMMAVIDELDDYKKLIGPLEEIGYHFMPDRVFEARERIFFPKGSEDNRTHHLNLVVRGGQQYVNNLLFRDYMRNNEKARKDYQALKQRLAEQFKDDRAAYTEAKSEFIENVLDQARVSKHFIN